MVAKILGICALVFFICFFGALIIVPIVEHRQAMKELEKNNKK